MADFNERYDEYFEDTVRRHIIEQGRKVEGSLHEALWNLKLSNKQLNQLLMGIAYR